MTRLLSCVLVTASMVAALLCAPGAHAVPSAVTYQGKLTDSGGAPVADGSRSMRFRLYNAQSGGSQLWDSGAMNVVTTGGVFSVALGAAPTPPITSSTLSSDTVWLGVTVGADPPLARVKMQSAPFALRAGDLDMPFSKTVSSSDPAFEVRNTGNDYAIRGESSSASFAGVAGFNTGSGQGVYGSSVSGPAMYGWNSGAGTVGFLASSSIGAYGTAGGTGYGVYGTSSGSGPGVYGQNTGTGPAAQFDGKVGIGLANPNRPLYVVQNTAGVAYPLKVDNPHSTYYSDAVGVLFSAGGDGGGNLSVTRGKGALVYDNSNTWNRGKFHFLQEPSANDSNPTLANAVMTIANNGKVGIGTSNPSEKLHVYGQDAFLKVDGGAGGLSGVRVEENTSPRWTMLFRQYQSDNLIFYDEVGHNDTLVLESNANTVKVNGNLHVTGAVKGDLGPNGGAPFPRPAYDSGWVYLGIERVATLTHNVGTDVDRYFVSMEAKGGIGITNYGAGAGSDDGVSWGFYYSNLTTSTVTVRRMPNDAYSAYVRIRIWVTN